MNQREIEEHLRDLGGGLPDKYKTYTRYDQVANDIQQSVLALRSTVKGDGACHNEFLAKACLLNTLRYCVIALYDLVLHITDKSPGGPHHE